MPEPAPHAALIQLMLQTIWAGMLLGVFSGAVIGLFFHDETWWGGYGSFRRRMARLGHISFFGLALVNATFALTLHTCGVAANWATPAAAAFLCGAATMPAICFLSAWKKPFRHAFFIPVLSVTTGMACTLLGLGR